MQTKIKNPAVLAVFEGYSEEIRARLMHLRRLVFEVVAENPTIGDIEETLKWGQISYLPVKRKIGTTIRIDRVKNTEQFALYVPCSTNLLDSYRSIFADTFEYEDDRAIILNPQDDLPDDAIKHCIELALTYHLKR